MNVKEYAIECVRLIRRGLFKLILPVRVMKCKKMIRRKGTPVNIIFLTQFPEMWNSEKSVYEHMIKHPDKFTVHIVAIPKVLGYKDGKLLFCSRNEMKEFLDHEGVEYIEGIKDGQWFDIHTFEPGVIILQRPYDYYMPDEYSQYTLSRHFLLCYIPYGFEFVLGTHLNIEYNDAALNSLYMVFADNKDTYDYVLKRSRTELKLGGRKVYNVGYPRFDLIDKEEQGNRKKTALWLPRWSVSESTDKSHFPDYFETLFSYFSNSDWKLIIRPHPLMFTNFVERGVLTEETEKEIKEKVEKSSNISWDQNADYIQTFYQTDFLICDYTSLMIEYFATGNPIIYCGATECFNTAGKAMDDGLYHAYSWSELEREIDHLIHGTDPLKTARLDKIHEILNNESNIGSVISDIIYDNSMKN